MRGPRREGQRPRPRADRGAVLAALRSGHRHRLFRLSSTTRRSLMGTGKSERQRRLPAVRCRCPWAAHVTYFVDSKEFPGHEKAGQLGRRRRSVGKPDRQLPEL
ncbi:MAG: hypothetical protein MZV70_49415 [Desulfobacterales bacterium]|nr:hypothetical protein [Desulfobacterales bacterium]